MDDVEGLIGELKIAASRQPVEMRGGSGVYTVTSGPNLYDRAASALTRLQGELAEAGMYTKAHEALDDLARERVAEARAERDAAISQRDEAVVRRDELEMFVTNLANADDEQDEWGGRDQFRDWRDKARSLLSERALVSSAATGNPSPLPSGSAGP